MVLQRLVARAGGVIAVAILIPAAPVLGQGSSQPVAPAPAQAPQKPTQPAAPAPADASAPDEQDDDSFITDKQVRQHKAEMERELRKLRLKYFGSIKKVEIRQEGIALLRAYTEPLIFPALVKIFERERHDVRTAILDHLVDQGSEEADVTLAWIAAFDRDEVIRHASLERLQGRMNGGAVPERIKFMILQALRSGSDSKMNGAAELAESLKLFDAIPWLISAQFGGPGTGGGGGTPEPRGDLAYIVIGSQTAFVSDLTPIVSDSAVAFDPTLSTLTTGVILRIQDAYVTTYRTIIQTVLVNMSSEAWGQSTEGLGYDGGKWWNWYRQDYLPYVGAKLAAKESDGSQETPREEPGTPVEPAPAPKSPSVR